MSEDLISTQIVEGWKSVGRQFTVPEMKIYSENSPIRSILKDIIPEAIALPASVVEIGAMYAPLSVELNRFGRMLLIDPIYSEKSHPDINHSGMTICSVPLPESLYLIKDWLQDPGLLILENVINYLDRNTVEELLNLTFSHVIVGNNSSASWGEKHSRRLLTPGDIQKTLENTDFNLIGNSFDTENTLVGIFQRGIGS